jgi:hypothetical protein
MARRRYSAFLSLPSKEMGIVKVTRRALASIVLVVGCGLLSGCGPSQGTVAPTPTKTETPTQSAAISEAPTQSAAISETPSSIQTALPAVVGEWERHGKQDGKPYTEHFALNPDGTYTIEARFDNPDAVLASSHGTYESTETTLTLTDQDAKTTSTPYYLDSLGRLVVDNKTESAWTRLH